MRTCLTSIVLFVAATTWVANASVADETFVEVNERFTQAANRTFKAFDSQHEQTWQRPFFFMQLADTQYGMFTGNKGFEQEVALVQQAVEHINRLRPRFVIVCGDLTNATPEHPRYQAQVAQYHQDFSQVDAEIPLVCVCGNHDIGNRPTATSIASYQKNFGDDYFSFWVGGVCNIVLNSSVLKDPSGAPEVLAAQHAWLEQQLRDAKTAKAKHVLLFQHHPLFLAKDDEPDQYFNIPLERRTPLLDQLKQADVRAVFAGHYHRNAYGLAGAMEMITTGPVGRPLGKDPSGFRIVTVFGPSGNPNCRMMGTRLYLAIGYGTLVVDAYLVLASIASKMMNSKYKDLLPPFGSGGGEPSHFMVLLIATWTAILAVGCLRLNRVQADKAPAAGTLWFILVLAIVWLSYLVPVIINVSWSLFVQGV